MRVIGLAHVDVPLVLVDDNAPGVVEVLEGLVQCPERNVIRREVRQIAVGVLPRRKPGDPLSSAGELDMAVDQLDGEVLDGLHFFETIVTCCVSFVVMLTMPHRWGRVPNTPLIVIATAGPGWPPAARSLTCTC